MPLLLSVRPPAGSRASCPVSLAVRSLPSLRLAVRARLVDGPLQAGRVDRPLQAGGRIDLLQDGLVRHFDGHGAGQTPVDVVHAELDGAPEGRAVRDGAFSELRLAEHMDLGNRLTAPHDADRDAVRDFGVVHAVPGRAVLDRGQDDARGVVAVLRQG